MNHVFKIIKIFLIWRILLFVPVIIGSVLLNYGSSYPFFEVSYYKELPDFLNFPIFTTWSNFDGVHYLNIATRGYMGEARFFPLLPILIFVLSLGNVFFPFTYIVALFLPNIFFAAAQVVFYKLLRLDYSEKLSMQAIIYLLIFPAAFFFAAVYTESLFLLLLVTAFYFARKGNWAPAILSGILLTSIRLVGIFVIPALIYEYFIQNKSLKFKNFFHVAAIFLLTPLGLVCYSVFNYQKWGSMFYFLSAQGELNNGRSTNVVIFPLQTIYRYFKILSSFPVRQFEWWIAIIELLCFIFGSILVYFAWTKKVRTSYLIFAGLAFFLPVLSGTFSGLPRYSLVIFPLFIALALIKSKSVKLVYTASSILLLFLLLIFFSRGYFIA